jgi:hypothetical protein
MLRSAVAQWPVSDPRVRWLALAAVTSVRGAGTLAVDAEHVAEQWLAEEIFDGREESVAEISERTAAVFEAASDPRPQDKQRSPIEAQNGERDRADNVGVGTLYGGLFFLLPLFARLRAESLPSDAGWLALRTALDRIRKGAPDPMVSLLPAVDMADVGVEFGPLPAGHDGLLHVSRWRTTWRVILDRTGRLPVAAWQGCAPTEVAEFARGAAIRRGGDFPQDIHPAAAAMALGAHRLARRWTGLGLPALIRRPARIAVSATHVDVFFRLEDAEPRIRRAGLDLDPGWVPWLGRVVSFHYVAEDSGHG